MDRRAIWRAQRRRQALEALEFERAREAALREQLEVIVTELDGPRFDEEIFGSLSPEDIAVVRPAVQPTETLELEGLEEEWMLDDAAAGPPDADSASLAVELNEAEIARLRDQIDTSEERQHAFERYLAALGE